MDVTTWLKDKSNTNMKRYVFYFEIDKDSKIISAAS